MAVTKYISYEVGDNCFNIGIEDPAVSSLSLFPNPVRYELNISNISRGATISVYDLNGKLLFEKTSLSVTEKMDVSPLNAGIYLIKVIDEQSIRTIKMIKQ
jgi:hypothetical protein